jgi:hypothetical protein
MIPIEPYSCDNCYWNRVVKGYPCDDCKEASYEADPYPMWEPDLEELGGV